MTKRAHDVERRVRGSKSRRSDTGRVHPPALRAISRRRGRSRVRSLRTAYCKSRIRPLREAPAHRRPPARTRWRQQSAAVALSVTVHASQDGCARNVPASPGDSANSRAPPSHGRRSSRTRRRALKRLPGLLRTVSSKRRASLEPRRHDAAPSRRSSTRRALALLRSPWPRRQVPGTRRRSAGSTRQRVQERRDLALLPPLSERRRTLSHARVLARIREAMPGADPDTEAQLRRALDLTNATCDAQRIRPPRSWPAIRAAGPACGGA
jgi:hypothetical protein